MDPCENIFDKPLTYESGWGKKLTYCIAFSNKCITDVTPRYVLNHSENLSRRILVDEQWLDELLNAKRCSLWEQLSSNDKQIEEEKHQMDLKDLM